MFAFFNSGEHSGASQPHRHLQFLPVESMKQGDDSGAWEVLTDVISSEPETLLPFTYFFKSLPPEPTPQQLHEAYMDLLAEGVIAVQRLLRKEEDAELASTNTTAPPGQAPISYNMAMTTSAMMIVPRVSEGAALHHKSGEEVGSVALNGTILGGTLMVKLREEWDTLRGDTEVLDSLLQSIGIPSQAEGQGSSTGKL